eukprot:m.18288 g.18288  ORF g.18288 m.18288 type:complete len:773 (-) comp7326_c0_seq2:38-2356(-)
MAVLLVLSLLLTVWGTAWAKPHPVSLDVTASDVVLSNGYVRAVFSRDRPAIYSLQADFYGNGDFGGNVLASPGIVLEREDGNGQVHSSSNGAAPGGVGVAVVQNTSVLVTVVLSSIVDDAANWAVNDTWTLSLSVHSRALEFDTQGRVTRTVLAMAVRHALYWQPQSVYALFDRGVVQMMNAPASGDFFGSTDTLSRVYALGGNHSIDILRERGASAGTVVVLSSESGAPYWGGLHVVLAGAYDRLDRWDIGWKGQRVVSIAAGTTWQTRASMAPNNFDFPVNGLTTAANMDPLDLRALLAGVYASPVGCLCTYDNLVEKGMRVAQIAPSIHHPVTAYGNTYNYFDPDNWIGLTAMMYSGDFYLIEQARLVLERSGSFLLPSGQLPHHFEGVKPTYIALSGATQTGPNLFWTLTCLRYVKESGDTAWLQSYMPKLRQSLSFLLSLRTPTGLLSCPGSLMIDVFIREHLTSDTNAMMVGLLIEFADAELFLGNTTGAGRLQAIASDITSAMNALLWNEEQNDHFVTQRNPDNTTRDFVDYDANLIAVANGVTSPDRSRAILKRIDGGRCTHGRATFVSELYYGPKDCFNGNVGDSWCSMARIGLFDAYARRRVGDQATFDDVILNPLRGDVLQYTWLRERYYCDGTQELNRTQYYFEYPAFVAMAIREVRYGINIRLTEISIAPFGPTVFSYHVGAVNVDYSDASVVFSLPGQDTKLVVITGMRPNATYTLNVRTIGPVPCPAPPPPVVASAHGTLTFNGFVSPVCEWTVSLK